MNCFNTYFYTQTVNNFQPLLQDDTVKNIIVSSLQYLVSTGMVKLYAFVMMPTHVHLLWQLNETERKESPAASFSKFTSHKFKEYLLQKDAQKLALFLSSKKDRSYQFWKRDPLAICITSEQALLQKLNYIHSNPVDANLCFTSVDFKFSSAGFYETGIDEFDMLTNVFQS